MKPERPRNRAFTCKTFNRSVYFVKSLFECLDVNPLSERRLNPMKAESEPVTVCIKLILELVRELAQGIGRSMCVRIKGELGPVLIVAILQK